MISGADRPLLIAPFVQQITMHPRTEATLEKLKRANWFSSVGVVDTQSAKVLSSWAEAVESCGSPDWEELCLEAANQYRERLLEKSQERFREWNNIVAKIKPATQLLVREKTEDVIRANTLPKVFQDTVEWDILHVAMEAEYADVFPPGFYAANAYWYVNGHFPCGWEGDMAVFPKGKLVIY